MMILAHPDPFVYFIKVFALIGLWFWLLDTIIGIWALAVSHINFQYEVSEETIEDLSESVENFLKEGEK